MLAHRVTTCALAALCALGPLGCASYTEETRQARESVITGRSERALRLINRELGVPSLLEVPEDLDDDKALLLLERATLLQAQGRFELAARDMMIVDQRLEWLDIDGAGVKDIAKYLYSDDVSDYRAPAYERLLLNTLNIINFLARYDLEGARVEARRFTIMETFYVDDQDQALLPGLIALGNYLSGAAFEASMDYETAARYYSRAWHFGIRDEDLRGRLLDLYRVSGYAGRELEGPFFERLRAQARQSPPLGVAEYRARHQSGDTLVIAQYGVTPYKEAQRVPVARAMTLARSTRRGGLSTSTRRQANSMMVSGALTTVNFPMLTDAGLPQRSATGATVSVAGRRLNLFQGMDVARAVEKAWLEIAGPLMAAAITRAVTRAVVGQGGRAASEVASQSDNSTVAILGILGWLFSLGAEAGMNAVDTPDTRSWTTLPAQIRLGRVKLPQGLQPAEIRVAGQRDRQLVPIWSERLNVVNFSRIR